MRLKRKRGKKISLDFSRPGSRRKRREEAADDRQRQIDEFIRRRGLTKCPAAYAHMDW